MNNHLIDHPHAFVKDNKIVNVAVLGDHNHDLLEAIKTAHQADWIQCCCDYGNYLASEMIWDGTNFIDTNNEVVPREVWPVFPPDPEPIEVFE